MQFKKKEFNVQEIVEAFQGGGLKRNPEYQRGATWALQQKQALIDSIFREYPLPPIFLEVKRTQTLGDFASSYEIIDGQQRILSMSQYFSDDFALLSPEDSKLRLPHSLRTTTAPWSKKRFSELADDMADFIRTQRLQIIEVSEVANSDEVRDLFIRLQSGTALTRQQIRDAWPGELGPRIERWAGKLTREPTYKFFDYVDRRGTRDDEGDVKDRFVKHRTTCAQLCALLLGRASNPFATPSITAGELDALYHEYTQVDPNNSPFERLERIFGQMDEVVTRIAFKQKGKKKVSKATMFALAMYLQDAQRSSNFRLTVDAKAKLAKEVSEPKVTQNSRASSGGVIKRYYEEWRGSLPEGIGVSLDSKRLFDDDQKKEIWNRDNGMCRICGDEVTHPEDAEYDHHPVPHRDGGQTTVENGRLVHAVCHPRGRPVSS